MPPQVCYLANFYLMQILCTNQVRNMRDGPGRTTKLILTDSNLFLVPVRDDLGFRGDGSLFGATEDVTGRQRGFGQLINRDHWGENYANRRRTHHHSFTQNLDLR